MSVAIFPFRLVSLLAAHVPLPSTVSGRIGLLGRPVMLHVALPRQYLAIALLFKLLDMVVRSVLDLRLRQPIAMALPVQLTALGAPGLLGHPAQLLVSLPLK